MCSFRPPLRKRNAENDENSNEYDDLCCSEDASTRDSQEVLSCGFLPPKQRKRTAFQPPLRDLVSPGQSYINQILHEDKNGVHSSGTVSRFELAPLSEATDQHDNSDGPTTSRYIPKKHHYFYHVGNKKIEQPVKPVSHKGLVEGTSKINASASCMDKNEPRFKIFEFQLSQVTEKEEHPCEKPKKEKPLTQLQCHMNMDIYHAVKKARQEIREIRRRYAAKKTGCFIQEPPSLQEDRQPLKVAVNFLTEEKLPHDNDVQKFFLSPPAEQIILIHEE